jgi:hypothetical protein
MRYPRIDDAQLPTTRDAEEYPSDLRATAADRDEQSSTTRSATGAQGQPPTTVTISSSPIIRARAVGTLRPQADFDPAAPPAELAETEAEERADAGYPGAGATASIAAIRADQSEANPDGEESQPWDRRRRLFRRRRS